MLNYDFKQKISTRNQQRNSTCPSITYSHLTLILHFLHLQLRSLRSLINYCSLEIQFQISLLPAGNSNSLITKKQIMKKAFHLLVVIAFMFPLFSSGQGKPNYVGEWYMRTAQGRTPQRVEAFAQAPSDFVRTKRYNLKANAAQLSSLLRTIPELVNLVVPYGGKTYTLKLARVDVARRDLRVRSSQGSASYVKGVQYRGIVENNPQHIASVSIGQNTVTGFFSTDEGNFVITKEGLDYIVYNDQVLKADGIIMCQTPDTSSYTIPATSQLVAGVGCKTVNVYFELDYAFYQAEGSSIQSATDYLMAFFSQVATLYANEAVAMQVSEVFVWNSPDPYAGMASSSDILTAFRTNRGSGFNGNLAHFCSTRSLGGGVGYVDVVCNKAYAYGVSQVYTYYNNFPTYSWTVEVVTHELGHNLGSPHTHSCSWSTGALDNCYTPEGSCAPGPTPTGGGTIMSYCHLTSIGINFNYGFGMVPGNRIRDRVLNATCISGTGTPVPPTYPATNLTATGATLNWGPVAGGTVYSAKYRAATSTNWIPAGNTPGTSISVTGLTANTSYSWQVKSDCSDFSTETTFTTTGTSGGTTCTAPSQLSSTNVSSSSATVSWSAPAGASSYTVQYRLASSSTWTSLNTNSTSLNLSGLTASTSYSWQVKADCSPYSTVSSFTTSGSTATVCNAPAQLSTTNITGSSATVAWETIAGASNYNVQYRVSTASTWASVTTSNTSVSLTGLTASVSYVWQVKADCSGFSPTASFTTLSGGTGTVCTPPTGMTESKITSTSVTLSWTGAAGAQSYNVHVREAGAKRTQNYNNVTGTSVNAMKLRSGRLYEWSIETKCTDGTVSANSGWKSFSTL
jgi:hypothetical protein